MKYFFKTAVLLVCAAVFLIACAKENQNGKMNVVVSGYVPYLLVKTVYGDLVNLSMLVPPGTEPHAFEPSAQDILKAQKADLFFYISDELEPWVSKVSPQAKALSVYATEKLPTDPHIWMNFDNMSKMAEGLMNPYFDKYQKIKKASPKRLAPQKENAVAVLMRNYVPFDGDLMHLDYDYYNALKNCKNRTIYHVGHLAFGYVAKKYNLKFKALFSADMDQEPSAKEIALMVKAIKESGAKYIFSEEQLNPALANTIAKETGAKILMLNTVEEISKEDFDAGKTYQALMYENLENLKIGLDCQGE